MKNKIYIIAVLGLTLLILTGCARVQDAVVDGAIRGTSRAASEKAEQEAYKKLAPQEEAPAPQTPQWNNYMSVHARIIFGYSFAPAGVWVSKEQYEPGEYTIHRVDQTERDSDVIVEKAFLKKLENGNEWWRVTWEEDDSEIIYEGLITPSGQLTKLMAQDSEGNRGEIRVQGGRIYRQPNRVSEEEIEQYKVGSKSIETPAGTFEGDKIRYSVQSSEGAGYILWWISPEVPGGVVKYQIHDEDDNKTLTATLTEIGQGAERKLK